jgi:transcriptional regulator with XRE-family HTH domain
MKTINIGIKLKDLRKKLNMTQETLCADICSQSEISKIEKNKSIPSSEVLKKLSDRLGVSIEYFLIQEGNHRIDYIDELKIQLEKARRGRDYKAIEEIIKDEFKNPVVNKNPYLNKLLNWHNGIIQYNLYKDSSAALNILLKCLDENKIETLVEIEIELLNSIGIIYRNEKKYQESQVYLKKALNLLKEYPLPNNRRIAQKVTYNLAKVYTDLGNYNESNGLCNLGISVCSKNEDLHLFVEFHYQSGRNWLLLGNIGLGLELWEKSLQLLKIEGKSNLAELIEKEIIYYKKTGLIL